MKIRNPIGKMMPVGNGYYYQQIKLAHAGYVKIWHHGKVIDRAMSVASARKMIRRYAQRSLLV